MEDIWKALKVAAEKAGQIGMTQVDLQRCNDLLTQYGEKRENLFHAMVLLLGQSDLSDLGGDWRDCCSNGKELLSTLNDAIPPGDGEGLAGMGLDSFYRGELKIWDENAKGGISSVANIISEIYKADIELIKKCNEDLKTVRDGDKVVQALIEKNCGSLTSESKGFLKSLTTKWAEKKLTGWMHDGDSKNYTKSWYQLVVKMLDDNYTAAKQKRVLKQQILDNIALLNKTKEHLSEEWIDEMYKKGEEFAKSLSQAGANGDYDARDWEEFGKQCIEKLAEMSSRSKEQSKIVFGELLPTFLGENSRAFAALTDDPDKLAEWRSDLLDDFRSIDDVFAQEDALIKSLVVGDFRQAASETFQEMRTMVTAGLNLLLGRTKDSEDAMKE